MAKAQSTDALATIDIVELAARLGVQVGRERNGEAKALCPFHKEATPSFTLYQAKAGARSHYHCFGCQAHGGAVDLVRSLAERQTFRDAGVWLEENGFLPNGAFTGLRGRGAPELSALEQILERAKAKQSSTLLRSFAETPFLIDVISSPDEPDKGKDPDSLLAGMAKATAEPQLRKWARPALDVIAAQAAGLPVEAAREAWVALPWSAQFQAAQTVARNLSGLDIGWAAIQRRLRPDIVSFDGPAEQSGTSDAFIELFSALVDGRDAKSEIRVPELVAADGSHRKALASSLPSPCMNGASTGSS